MKQKRKRIERDARDAGMISLQVEMAIILYEVEGEKSARKFISGFVNRPTLARDNGRSHDA